MYIDGYLLLAFPDLLHSSVCHWDPILVGMFYILDRGWIVGFEFDSTDSSAKLDVEIVVGWYIHK